MLVCTNGDKRYAGYLWLRVWKTGEKQELQLVGLTVKMRRPRLQQLEAYVPQCLLVTELQSHNEHVLALIGDDGAAGLKMLLIPAGAASGELTL